MKKIKSSPGRESVWDYPRPPRLELTGKTLIVELGGEVIAQTTRGYRVLETSHPPTYYFPPEDVRTEFLIPSEGVTICEWKGRANYFDLQVGTLYASRAAWTYPEPKPPYIEIAGYLCFYPSKVDRCLVGGEEAKAQEGNIYGGWITTDIQGPFKGGPGTGFW